MTHPHVRLVKNAYSALNNRDIEGFLAPFADDAELHGADRSVEGKQAIGMVVRQLIELSNDTLHIDIHDVLANDEHTVVLQTTTARLGEKRLSDRVVYVYHIDNQQITDAWFSGDPRVQEEFYGLA